MGTALFFIFFFFNDTATTEIYTLSLHDALPISAANGAAARTKLQADKLEMEFGEEGNARRLIATGNVLTRSEEHTSELQSQSNLVCRLLLEKKKKHTHKHITKQTAYNRTSLLCS